MEQTNRPYRYRVNLAARAIHEARELRAEAMMLETISIRERIRPIEARRISNACQMMGL